MIFPVIGRLMDLKPQVGTRSTKPTKQHMTNIGRKKGTKARMTMIAGIGTGAMTVIMTGIAIPTGTVIGLTGILTGKKKTGNSDELSVCIFKQDDLI